ncbi:single-stranded-DNA-specific exonuclease RecJ [Bythopirellula polymerisocia]|uniref:Single-stranded-DNA-specific exonuclease RecJ n=1 Tax=Bythopirellula polymerisocia TaxID=2528003 RepID=A0A5C6CRU1_9BACT|nr:single-stranded-DNA-specific exonuclease RecJ [Bythopirellula polymerisocia]TWU25836.1 Single-stranded-DNA-specific exonuclease RecJ [Bythopirellula polymerisocia]
MPKRWRIANYDADCVAALQQSAGIPAVVAQLLLSRGISDPDVARQFLDPKLNGLRDPALLPGATQAAEIIYAAIQSGDKITIYGDYDADGMTATAILFRCLKLLHADVDYYVPHRIDEGYSLNVEALDKIASQGSKLVITVDCGVASVAEAQHARDLGLTLIITDHHQMADQLPPAAAIVHPGLPGGDYPFAGLCGAAVAFKVAWAVCQFASEGQKVTDRLRSFLLQAVGLAAIGTVADVVPLVDENRILVRYGLGCLKSEPNIGIAALLRSTKLHGKSHLAGDDLGYSIGPRLNAAGRLGQAELAIELLTTESPQRADTIAQYMEELNLQRQTLERSMARAAAKQARTHGDPDQAPALVLADHDWHAGVIGIVAGRLAEKHSCPVVMIANDPLGVKPGIGSARSVPGFNLHEALAECGHLLESHGGHAAAAGLRIAPDNIAAFRKAFCQIAAEQLNEGHKQEDLLVDAEASLQMLTRHTVEQIESLAPFGQGNSAPMLCATEVRLSGAPKRIGSTGRHLSMMFDQYGIKMRAVAFGGGDWESELAGIEGPMSIAFRPVINNFRGRTSVEIHLADWRVE